MGYITSIRWHCCRPAANRFTRNERPECAPRIFADYTARQATANGRSEVRAEAIGGLPDTFVGPRTGARVFGETVPSTFRLRGQR